MRTCEHNVPQRHCTQIKQFQVTCGIVASPSPSFDTHTELSARCPRSEGGGGGGNGGRGCSTWYRAMSGYQPVPPTNILLSRAQGGVFLCLKSYHYRSLQLHTFRRLCTSLVDGAWCVVCGVWCGVHEYALCCSVIQHSSVYKIRLARRKSNILKQEAERTKVKNSAYRQMRARMCV